MSLSTIEIIAKLKILNISLSYKVGCDVPFAIYFNGEMSEDDYGFYFNNYQKIITLTQNEWKSIPDIVNVFKTNEWELGVDC